jgi:hypothetical protein
MIIFLDDNDKENFLLASDCLHLIVLHYIIKEIGHDSNCWYADADNKQVIIDELNISTATLNRQIKILKKNRIIKSEARGKYKLNLNMLKL